jgi:Plasmid encoded RepA protein
LNWAGPSARFLLSARRALSDWFARDPGDDLRLRKRGNAALKIEAGHIPDPARGEHINVGLRWGAKPHFILAHLNAEALRPSSPDIEIQAHGPSLDGFAASPGGREIRMFKHQLSCLSTATIRLAVFQGEHALANTHVIYAFELWLHKDERQRVLWPSMIRLSNEYFESLRKHAVPLNFLTCWAGQRSGHEEARHLRPFIRARAK